MASGTFETIEQLAFMVVGLMNIIYIYIKIGTITIAHQ
jgi:hypothetical protein